MDRVMQKSKVNLNQSTREFMAEMMGTFIMVMFGIGSVAQHILSDGKLGTYLSVNFGWGLGVTFGIFWSYGTSGGHINPAVTFANVVCGRMPLRKLPLYWIAQSVGAFMASALVFVVYKDLLDVHDHSKRNLKNAAIWSVYPHKGVSHGTVFWDQVTGTAFLVGTIFSLSDKRNSAPREALFPVAVGFLVVAIGESFGLNCGYGINPARDLIPRIFTAVAGWGSLPFTANNYFFWIPIVGQLCGAVLGAFLYIITIELHHPEKEGSTVDEVKGKEEEVMEEKPEVEMTEIKIEEAIISKLDIIQDNNNEEISVENEIIAENMAVRS